MKFMQTVCSLAIIGLAMGAKDATNKNPSFIYKIKTYVMCKFRKNDPRCNQQAGTAERNIPHEYVVICNFFHE